MQPIDQSTALPVVNPPLPQRSMFIVNNQIRVGESLFRFSGMRPKKLILKLVSGPMGKYKVGMRATINGVEFTIHSIGKRRITLKLNDGKFREFGGKI